MQDAEEEIDPHTASAKLATILAVITKQAHYIGQGLPNEYVQAMESVRELEGFAAVVYSSAFELENMSAEVGEGGGGVVEKEKEKESVSDAPLVVEEVTTTEAQVGEIGGAGGMVDKAWSGFESVWGRVTGRGGGGQGPLTG